MSKLTEFLTAYGRDTSGRTHEEVLRLKDASLESMHDLIQWLFPLPEPSRAVPGSPVLSQADILILRHSLIARMRMRASAQHMLQFYRNHANWLAAHDHNHFRISRIIRSLRLIVGDEDADAFRSVIMALVAEAKAAISSRTLSHWAAA